MGTRSSLHIVVKTGTPTSNKELTLGHQISDRWSKMKGVLSLSGLKKCWGITWTCFHTVPFSLKMKNHGQAVYTCISPLKLFNIFQQNMTQSLHITFVCRIYFFLLTTFISQQTQTEQFHFCLFKDMVTIMTVMTTITKKTGTWRKIQISLRPAAFNWKFFFDILYTEWYAKKIVYLL